MTLRRCTALAAATTAVAALAWSPPAAADAHVEVSLDVEVGGSRQFDVLEESSDTTLRKLDLASSGSRSFRTRVRDENFDAAGKTYTVGATMSNLYRRSAVGTTGDPAHDVDVKVRSAELALATGALSVDAPLVGLVPSLAISGTLLSCAELPDEVKNLLGLPLGDLTLLLADAGNPLHALCTALAASAQQVVGTANGKTQSIQTSVVDTAKLPTVLTSGPGSHFTNADYAHDATARTEPAAVRTAAPATSVTVMRGAPATDASADELLAQVSTRLADTLATTPLTGPGGDVNLTDLRSMISDSSLRNAVASLPEAQQIALLNTLPQNVVSALSPTLARMRITTDSYAKPTLTASMQAPLSGTYDGTLTLTFVQS